VSDKNKLPHQPNASEIDRIVRDLQEKLDAVPDLLFELDIEGRIISFHSPRRELL
jgi:PAS domain-containing protein